MIYYKRSEIACIITESYFAHLEMKTVDSSGWWVSVPAVNKFNLSLYALPKIGERKSAWGEKKRYN